MTTPHNPYERAAAALLELNDALVALPQPARVNVVTLDRVGKAPREIVDLEVDWSVDSPERPPAGPPRRRLALRMDPSGDVLLIDAATGHPVQGVRRLKVTFETEAPRRAVLTAEFHLDLGAGSPADVPQPAGAEPPSR